MPDCPPALHPLEDTGRDGPASELRKGAWETALTVDEIAATEQTRSPGLPHLASRTLSLSSLPHSQPFPGSTAKCKGSSLCSASVSGITAAEGETRHQECPCGARKASEHRPTSPQRRLRGSGIAAVTPSARAGTAPAPHTSRPLFLYYTARNLGR